MGLKSLPNILTALRIALGVGAFAALVMLRYAPDDQDTLALISFWAFVAAALTDFLDGWLARRLNAKSAWGAMLDPIADKIAVALALMGLAACAPTLTLFIAGGTILFREVFISGLREAGAARGLAFPVTRLAKWKTTFQLAAVAGEILALTQPEVGPLAHALLWIAAALSLWTGLVYAREALNQLGEA